MSMEEIGENIDHNIGPKMCKHASSADLDLMYSFKKVSFNVMIA
jgi:hypothetical protein